MQRNFNDLEKTHMINLISIGSDRNLFKEGSAARARQVEYGQLFNELHIVVFTKGRSLPEKIQIAPNVWVYGTRSLTKFSHIRRATEVASRVIKERNFLAKNTVVTVQDPFESGVVGARLKKKIGMGLHVQIHTDFLTPYFAHESLLNRLRIRAARKILPLADAVRVVSKKVADDLLSAKSSVHLKPGVVPTVLPIFVDLKKIQESSVGVDLKKKYPQFNFIILMASRLTKEKNIPFAINLFKKLVSEYQHTGLVIVGSGPEQKKLAKQVARFGLEKSVMFESWQDDLSSYYKTAHMFLLTSNYEGYGMTLVEATACHCPAVSSDVGIAAEILKSGNESFACPVGDTACFFDAISKLIESPAVRTIFVHEARRRLETITMQDKKTYLDLYQKNIESAVESQSALKKELKPL